MSQNLAQFCPKNWDTYKDIEYKNINIYILIKKIQKNRFFHKFILNIKVSKNLQKQMNNLRILLMGGEKIIKQKN